MRVVKIKKRGKRVLVERRMLHEKINVCAVELRMPHKGNRQVLSVKKAGFMKKFNMCVWWKKRCPKYIMLNPTQQDNMIWTKIVLNTSQLDHPISACRSTEPTVAISI